MQPGFERGGTLVLVFQSLGFALQLLQARLTFERCDLELPRPCSMSSTGRQLSNSCGEDCVYASRRRQGGKVGPIPIW